ncbi:MAG: hypothetical protein ACREUU_19945 [Gammaproteobacteria bacterium]
MKDINAYLIFKGNCREAMTFYGKCFGAELHLATFADMPGMPFQQGNNFFVDRFGINWMFNLDKPAPASVGCR